MSDLTTGDFTRAPEPYGLLEAWLAEARGTEINDPEAMALATVDPDGLPDVRVVLLKGIGSDGLTFYTNVESAKGAELAANPKAAVVLHWKSLRRQVRARGPVTPVGGAEADAYFASRSRDSRIGAWASRQSRPVASREALEAEVARFAAAHEGREVPRPPHWSGFRIAPVQFEFWRDGAHRLHDRVRFTRAGHGWERARLYP